MIASLSAERPFLALFLRPRVSAPGSGPEAV
jgi:hypothetical protein